MISTFGLQAKLAKVSGLVTLVATLLSACGGGVDGTAASPPQAPMAFVSAAAPAKLESPLSISDSGMPTAQPAFHVAPVLLESPDDSDTPGHSASARRPPHRQEVPAEFKHLASRRLTHQTMESVWSQRLLSQTQNAAHETASPLGSSSSVATYTPAQIRAAYGMPALPSAGTLTPTQAAQLGAGQTIYVIAAQHNPNTVAELAAFNQRFGLPTCTTKAIAPNASLPLAAASGSDCEISVVYSTVAGSMTSTAPAYDAGWATEIALDIQWTHATAPLARLVLIEAASATQDNLMAAVRLANAMGPGIVSMSFGSSETSNSSLYSSVFSAVKMTYLASTGDYGAGVSFPSNMANVVAVGGTNLSYSGTGTRSESAWSGTGGGTSAYIPRPAYQGNAVPGLGSPARRTLADVAFNADPYSGQYVAVIKPGSSTVNWISSGGTSLSTPQWAGLFAVANALRAQAGKPPLGVPHVFLYGQIASVPGTYASVFADITKGSNGTCATCTAKQGYDTLTGLGTPNTASLMSNLLSSTAPPVVNSASTSGKAGSALTYNVAVNAANPVTYTLGAAPSGMAIGATGVISWTMPVVGTYPVVVTARDSVTGLSGQGTVTFNIATQNLTITPTSFTAVAGKPLSATTTIANPSSASLSVSLAGVPSGMTYSYTGSGSITAIRFAWPNPVKGNYTLVLSVSSAVGISAQANVSITVSAK